MFDRRARVLIVDGDPNVRRSLCQRLLDNEVFSDSVSDGKMAMDALSDSKYAVVVLDLAISGVSAEMILERIASLPANVRPVVLGTGLHSAARSLDADVVQIVIRKPCDLAQLAEIVRSCVRNAADSIRKSDGLILSSRDSTAAADVVN